MRSSLAQLGLGTGVIVVGSGGVDKNGKPVELEFDESKTIDMSAFTFSKKK